MASGSDRWQEIGFRGSGLAASCDYSTSGVWRAAWQREFPSPAPTSACGASISEASGTAIPLVEIQELYGDCTATAFPESCRKRRLCCRSAGNRCNRPDCGARSECLSPTVAASVAKAAIPSTRRRKVTSRRTSSCSPGRWRALP